MTLYVLLLGHIFHIILLSYVRFFFSLHCNIVRTALCFTSDAKLTPPRSTWPNDFSRLVASLRHSASTLLWGGCTLTLLAYVAVICSACVLTRTNAENFRIFNEHSWNPVKEWLNIISVIFFIKKKTLTRCLLHFSWSLYRKCVCETQWDGQVNKNLDEV